MGKGQEFLHRLNEALGEFEQAIVRREHKRLLDSAVALQQEVDHAHDHVIETVVDVVREAREEYSTK